MPSVRTRITDFTSGEWGPQLPGRVDLDKYSRAARVLENFLILQGGGLRRRPGSRYVATAPGTSRVRLIPFEFSETDAYVLAFTESTIRFYKDSAPVLDGAGLPVEVAHSYTAQELFELDWAQSADILFLTHQAHPPAQLSRLTADGLHWRLRDIPFSILPSVEYGTRPVTTITPGATSGLGVTFTAGAPLFLSADNPTNILARRIVVLAGPSTGATAKITSVTDSQHVVCDIEEPFDSVAAIAASDWKLDASPLTTCTPSAKTPVGATVTLTLANPGWRADDVNKVVPLDNGLFLITAFTSDLVVSANIESEADATTGAPAGAWTLEEAAFSAAHGYPAAVTFFKDRFWLFGTPSQPQSGWGSKTGDYFNFAIGALADDALAFTLNSDQVNPIRWAIGSRKVLVIGTSGEEWIVDPGDQQVLTPSNFNAVVQTSYGSAAHGRALRIGNVVLFPTRSRRKIREFVFQFEVDGYVAPDLTLLAEHITAPARVNAVPASRSLVELAFQREPQQTLWAVRDDGTLLSLAYIREQNVVGWARHVLTDAYPDAAAVDGDGRMIPPPADGRVESVCVIPHPNGDRDQVWLAVQRTVAGAAVRQIEWLDDAGVSFDDGLTLDAARTVDGQQYAATLTLSAESGAGVNFTASLPVFAPTHVGSEIRSVTTGARATITGFLSPTAVTGDIAIAFTGLGPTIAAGGWGLAFFAVDGLDHLEGRSVAIVGDGAVYPPATVVGGAVAIAPAAIKIEIGLGFTSRVIPNPPEVAALGTIQGLPKRHGKVYLRLRKSLGGSLDGTLIPFRRGGDPLGTGVPVFSGDLPLTHLGWDRVGELEITQTQPLPFTLLGLFTLLGTED